MSNTHRLKFLRAHQLEDKPYSLPQLAKISGVSLATLKEVHKRGVGAYKTQPESVRMKGSFKKGVNAPMSQKLSPQQWAMARVYSFLDGNKKHDTDLRGGRRLVGGDIKKRLVELKREFARKYDIPRRDKALETAIDRLNINLSDYYDYRSNLGYVAEKFGAEGQHSEAMDRQIENEWIAKKTKEMEALIESYTKPNQAVAEWQATVRRPPRALTQEEMELKKEAQLYPLYAPSRREYGEAVNKRRPTTAPRAGIGMLLPPAPTEGFYGLETVEDAAPISLYNITVKNLVDEAVEARRRLSEAMERLKASNGERIYAEDKVVEEEEEEEEGGGRKRKIKGGAWYDVFNPSKVINEFVNPDSVLRRRVSDVSKGIRVGFSPSARDMIAKYGNGLISSVIVRRVPIQSALHTAFELVTLGKWSKARAEENQDKLFHLGVVLQLRQPGLAPKWILVEKNEVVNVGEPKGRTTETEDQRCQVPKDTTLSEFLEKSIKSVGDERFFKYDPFKNNCQDFVALCLRANGVYTPDVEAFVKQPIDSLLSRLPSWTGAVAKGITDLGGIVNVATEGAGKSFAKSSPRPAPKFEKQLKKAGFDSSSYLKEAQRKAKEHGLPYKLLGFASDGEHKLAIPDSEGRVVAFGKVGYGDHLIYTHQEESGKVPHGTAEKKKNTFQRSHQKIKGDWKSNPFSPNNLALNVLW